MSTQVADCGGCCPGPAGPQGPQGIQGAQGIPGAQGVTGANGLNGTPGIQGPAGPAGAQGPQGQIGPQGLQGATGKDGSAGMQGVPGIQGPVGAQGMQGIPGDCVNCSNDASDIEFAEAYSQKSQTLIPSLAANMAGGTVLLENLIVATANIDASNISTTGQMVIKKAGWYDVAAGMTGTLNPIPAPLPVWTLSLFVNNTIVPGSTFSNVPLSPAQSSTEITADTYVYFNVGDSLSLANTSASQVFLTAPSLGTNAQTNSAYLKIQLLRAGAK